MAALTLKEIARGVLYLICVGIYQVMVAVGYVIRWLSMPVSAAKVFQCLVAVAIVIGLVLLTVDVAIPHQNMVNSNLAASVRGAK